MMISFLIAAALGQAATATPARGPRMDRGARMERMFDMADTDRNGQISRAEFRAARERMHQRRAQRREGGRGWGGRGEWGAQGAKRQ